MEGFRQLTDGEIEDVYRRLELKVESWRDQYPTIRLAGVDKRDIGEECISCPLIGIASFSAAQATDELRTEFGSGAYVDTEKLPNGSFSYVINIPLWVKRQSRNNNNNTRRYTAAATYNYTAAKSPSREWIMFLIMILGISAGILWYRITMGIDGMFYTQ